MLKTILGLLFLVASSVTLAGGYSNWAVPVNIELVNGGVLIQGAFGDPNSCGEPNYIFVSESDSKYQSLLSLSLAAFMSQKEMQFYANKCKEVGFH